VLAFCYRTAVATLHVRNVPDSLYQALRERAERHGRSIGGETVTILEDALRGDRAVAVLGGIRGRFRRSRPRSRTPFDQFTDRARRAISLAQEEARALNHGYVGTEHFLLGLMRVEDGVAARALAKLGLRLEDARARVVAIIGRGEETPMPPIPFTPRAKKVLELALRESLSLGQGYVGTEHLLLGLGREAEGVAARILLDLDAGPERVREAVTSVLATAPTVEVFPGAEDEISFARWEYRVIPLEGSAEAWSEQLNATADEGWELCDVRGTGAEQKAVFRRPRG
jgi:Clp amino terminal domain, pathogenicity island component